MTRPGQGIGWTKAFARDRRCQAITCIALPEAAPRECEAQRFRYGEWSTSMAFYPPSLRYGLHPLWPERMGYRRILKITHPSLARLLAQTDPFTLVSGRNRTTLFREATKILRRGVPGAFAEIGVHRGGSAAILAEVLKSDPQRELHLFDRWGDLPDPTEEDGHRGEQYRKENIHEKLEKLKSDPPLLDAQKILEDVVGLPGSRIHYHQGWYNETLPNIAGVQLAFVSVDCDYFQSVALSLEHISQNIAPGGIVVVDDYRAWPGSRKATDDFVAEQKGRVELTLTPTGPAILEFR